MQASETTSKFDQWAILEIMGHQRYAGRVTEQSVGGQSFVRIDVPEVSDRQPAFTKLFGSGAVYCITPVSEEVARMVASQLRQEVVSVFDLPNEVRQRLQQSDHQDGDSSHSLRVSDHEDAYDPDDYDDDRPA